MTLIGPADFYHLDYLHKPLSRGNSRRSTRPYSPSPATSRFTRRSPPKKLNMAVLDDPLLAQMAAASPLTPPAEETLFQPLDVSLKYPDSPMAEQFADEYMESVAEEPEVDVESAHLVTHAKVYAIAEKYVCPSVISAPGFLLFFLFDRALATSLCCRVTSGKSPRSLRGASPASSKGQSRPPHHNPAHGVLQRHCPITNL
jgi:hypothetical protein